MDRRERQPTAARTFCNRIGIEHSVLHRLRARHVRRRAASGAGGYDASGERAGIPDVTELVGGMGAWRASKLAVEHS